jgi:uncharacterized FlgJ-related protein
MWTEHLPNTAHDGFKELLTAVACTEIEYPALKGIVAAQWALESGWGKSRLAVEHKNFGGLKWRPYMAECNAVPVRHKAWDGGDTYARFTSASDFIDAYWRRFDEISVYDGWTAAAEDGPEAFIRFIARHYLAGNPRTREIYVKNIMSISKRTEKALREIPCSKSP